MSLIVVAVMVLSMLPMGAMAAEVLKEAPAVRPQTIEKPPRASRLQANPLIGLIPFRSR